MSRKFDIFRSNGGKLRPKEIEASPRPAQKCVGPFSFAASVKVCGVICESIQNRWYKAAGAATYLRTDND